VALADRVSVNLEAPTESALAKLAPHKRLFDELVRPLRLVRRLRLERGGQPGAWGDPSRGGPSQTTQFVVGPGGESDRDLLLTTQRLRWEAGLARTYFKAFTPVRDTPLARHPAESPVREHRLYQSDFLLRDYGFTAEELPYDPAGRLPLDADPKLAWARDVLAEEPVELNTAEHSLLLRVPGIGPTGARRLGAARRGCTLRGLDQLRSLGILADRAAPFVLLDGKRPAHQLDLFGAA
jgi:predicted DNA-binding helix-hairpin-helix protein